MTRQTLFKLLLIAAMAFATITVVSNIGTGPRGKQGISKPPQDSACAPMLAVVVPRAARKHPRPQDDRYDRRRAYWEERLERELDDEESLDGDDDETSAKNTKDSKSKKDDAADDSDSASQKEHDEVEQRREYWRNRLEREW